MALRFLSHRPRSEAEVRRRLLKSFPHSRVEETISRLRDRGLLNDRAFARFWRDNREQHRPRSGAMIRQELSRMGVGREVADEALEGLDEAASALQVGRKLLPRLGGADFNTFRSKVGNHLRRRGFGYGLAAQAVDELWRELADTADGYVECDDQE